MADKTEAKQSKPKSGICEFSGEPTKGGRFKPGGDAKLKSLLLNEGTPQAAAEMVARGWFRDHVHLEHFGEETVRQAEELLPENDEDREAWLASVVKARIS